MLALILTAIVLLTQLISSVSTARLTEIVWRAWTAMSPSQEVRELRSKRDELMRVRQERSNTPSQDEFAKWARLDRDHQRLKKEYDAMNTKVGAQRQKVTAAVRAGKWFATTGVRLIVQWKYRRAPVVWLPPNVLPHRVEWFLALPSAPLGSISAATWVFATNSIFTQVWGLTKRVRLQKSKAQ